RVARLVADLLVALLRQEHGVDDRVDLRVRGERPQRRDRVARAVERGDADGHATVVGDLHGRVGAAVGRRVGARRGRVDRREPSSREPFFGSMSRISIAMDDPELRQGAELMEVVTRQLETVPQVANALAMPANVPTSPTDTPGINSPSEIAVLADRHDTFRRQADALR